MTPNETILKINRLGKKHIIECNYVKSVVCEYFHSLFPADSYLTTRIMRHSYISCTFFENSRNVKSLQLEFDSSREYSNNIKHIDLFNYAFKLVNYELLASTVENNSIDDPLVNFSTDLTIKRNYVTRVSDFFINKQYFTPIDISTAI
jgi:hypothetical protein